MDAYLGHVGTLVAASLLPKVLVGRFLAKDPPLGLAGSKVVVGRGRLEGVVEVRRLPQATAAGAGRPRHGSAPSHPGTRLPCLLLRIDTGLTKCSTVL